LSWFAIQSFKDWTLRVIGLPRRASHSSQWRKWWIYRLLAQLVVWNFWIATTLRVSQWRSIFVIVLFRMIKEWIATTLRRLQWRRERILPRRFAPHNNKEKA
jgi:hypothetical protein